MQKRKPYDFYQYQYQFEKKDGKELIFPHIPCEVKDKALSLIFGSSITEGQRKALYKHIDNEFSRIHCSVMLITDNERSKPVNERENFARLCSSLGIDPGHKEIIINSSYEILYSHDYLIRPKLVI